jgi:hypothetical protein
MSDDVEKPQQRHGIDAIKQRNVRAISSTKQGAFATALAKIRVEWRIYKVAEAIHTKPWRSNIAPDRPLVGGRR